MKKYKLDKFTKGWFIGNFKPSLLKTKDFEIAVKYYKKGDRDPKHYHKVATEFTIITQGSCNINGEVFRSGDIILMEPSETAEFEALEDCVNTVIKIPSVKGDKYKI